MSMPYQQYIPQSIPAMGGLDYSQGKWFAPGEPLPEGWVVTAHPEGAAAPLESHNMTEAARAQSFVATGMEGTGAASAASAGSASKDLATTTTSKKASKKKSSKKKKSSG